MFCALVNGTRNLYNKKKLEYLDNNFITISSSEMNYYKFQSTLEDVEIIDYFYPLDVFTIEGYNFSYHDENLVSILEGRGIEDIYEILIPDYATDYQIGSILNIEGNTLVVVGIYDSSVYSFSKSEKEDIDTFYCSYDFYIRNIDLNHISEIVLKIDDYEHFDKAIEQLSNLTKNLSNVSIGIYDQDHETLARFYQLSSYTLLIKNIFLPFIMLFILGLNRSIEYDNKTYFATLKCFGYPTLSIVFILFLQTILLFLLGFILGTLISFLTNFFLQLTHLNLFILEIKDVFSCLLLFCASIGIATIRNYFVINRKNAVETLKTI